MKKELFTARVYGLPRPQGSLSYYGVSKRTGKAIVSNSKQLLAWRETCVKTFTVVLEDMTGFEKVEEKCHVDMDFFFARPQRHFRADKVTLKHDAPVFHDKVPDLDKLIRGVNDALTYGQVWTDDSLMASCMARKFYTNNPADAGVLVSVSRL